MRKSISTFVSAKEMEDEVRGTQEAKIHTGTDPGIVTKQKKRH